jgi:hypothetical protein
MVEMVAAINRTNFAGVQRVTCWTCHHGRITPATTVSLDAWYDAPNIELDDTVRQETGQPTADQVLDKFIQALGGAQPLAGMTSFVATGTAAGYGERMQTFFRSNPGLSSRIAHHLDFPDYLAPELEEIAQRMLLAMQYRLSDSGAAALRDYIPLRMQQPHFANARSIRNALDRARLRQANRLFAQRGGRLTRDELMTIEGEDLRASRVFA